MIYLCFRHNLARTRTILSLKINLFTSLYCACVMLQLVPCSQKLSTRGVAGLIYVYMSMLIIYVQDVVADTNTFVSMKDFVKPELKRHYYEANVMV